MLLSAFFTVALLETADAATSGKSVCVNRKGAIVVRAKCKKREKTLSAASLSELISKSIDDAGLIGPQGSPGVQGATGPIGPLGPQGIVGGKGPKGQIDLSACHVSSEGYSTNFFNTGNPVLYVEAGCHPTAEFLLEDEYRVTTFPGSSGTDVAIQARISFSQDVSGDTREYAVGIYANRVNVGGLGAFELIMRAICCPR